MSVSLFVSLERSVTLAEIESLTCSALGKILNVEPSPEVVARFDPSWSVGEAAVDLLQADSKRVLCSIPGYEEQASIMLLKLPSKADYYGNDTASYRDFLSIKWAYMRSPLNSALCAAIAAGIALSQDAEIHDNGGFYTMNTEPTPREFVETLALPLPQKDLQEAAALLYDRMPKSIEVRDVRSKETT